MSEEGERVKSRMQEIGRHVNSRIPKGWGFVVLCFTYGPGGEMHYVASSERLDIVQAMREWIQITRAGYATHQADEESALKNEFEFWWAEQLKRQETSSFREEMEAWREVAYDAFVAAMHFENQHGPPTDD